MRDQNHVSQAARGVPETTDFSAVSGVSAPREQATPEGRPLPGRYEDLGWIGSGGFGEVRRVRDTLLNRVVAMKILRPDLTDDLRARRRFLTEVQITADLQHPGIIAVYDQGELADGRLWFTMKEVRGRTLRDLVVELHASASAEGFGVTPSGWTFRRLVDAFARIVQAVAYAHGRGVVHRDLKPDNLMIGEFGEVVVMDWGLARRVDEADAPEGEGEPGKTRGSVVTRHGEILGTPAYMPPEQARGDRTAHGPWSDVYALGAVLYTMLTGRPPYQGSGAQIVAQLRAGPSPRVSEVARGGPPVPAELSDACERAMRREIADRYPSAERLAEEILGWLDGTRRREQALRVVGEARSLLPPIRDLRARAAQCEAEARRILGPLRPADPVEQKRPGWRIEDEAAQLSRAAVLRETEWLQMVHGALILDPDLPEAHAILADYYRDQLARAEIARRHEDVARFEALLRAHDRGQHAAFLRGDGALSLVTDPPGAEVSLYRYELHDRQLVPEYQRELGPTPLDAIPLVRGSYLLRIRAKGRAEVRYPVLIERGGHWDGRAPGEAAAHLIALPPEGELGPEDVYVPAGWCWIGDDLEAADSLSRRRIWVDGFIVRRFPVTNREYLEFLNDLVASGREVEALRACPRAQVGMTEAADDRLVYGRDSAGRFVLAGDEMNPTWELEWPATLVDWHGAVAYADWLSARTGRPWRLLNELEREKATRGVDGRKFPWGDQPEATFACVLESHTDKPARVIVDSYPVDESPYGARGLGGNARDWCINVWKYDGPALKDGRLLLDAAAAEDPDYRAVRGGGWGSALHLARAAARFGNRPEARRITIGLRVARSFPGPAALRSR